MCWNRVPELRPEFPTIQKLLTEQIEDHGAQFMSEIRIYILNTVGILLPTSTNVHYSNPILNQSTSILFVEL